MPSALGIEADPEMLVERRLRSAELAVQAARRRAAEAEQAAAQLASQMEQLERELDGARREPERLHDLLADRERARRAAEQRAHAERALREELQDELAQRAREQGEAGGAQAALAASRARVRELKAELASLRRRADEAEHLAAAAQAIRVRAEHQVAELTTRAGRAPPARPVPPPPPAQPAQPAPPGLRRTIGSGISRERQIAARTPPAMPVQAATPASRPDELRGLRQERELITARTLRPVRTPTSHPTPSAAPASKPQPADDHGTQLSVTLAALRTELDELRTMAEREGTARVQAQERAALLECEVHAYVTRCADADHAIEGPRDELDALRHASAAGATAGPTAGATAGPTQPEGPPQLNAPSQPQGPPQPDGPVQSERLEAALSRLRESIPVELLPEEGPDRPEPAAGRRAWPAGVFLALAKRDPAAAGRLAIGLLPAQALVHPDPLAYDLVLEDLGCVQVSVVIGGDGAGRRGAFTRVQIAGRARPRAEIQVQVVGDLASLGRLLAAGPARHRFRLGLRRGLARVRGDRKALLGLTELVRAPLSPAELNGAGVRLEPSHALSVIAALIDSRWTKGETFTIAHWAPGAPEAYLHVADGRPLSVTDSAPPGPATTTIVGPADSLLMVIEGGSAAGLAVHGDERPLALVQDWVKRAQSG